MAETTAVASAIVAPEQKISRIKFIIYELNNQTERSKREVEAEAVAYVIGRHCGLDTSGSAFYLATWESDDPEVVRERLGRISRTAQEIIGVVED